MCVRVRACARLCVVKDHAGLLMQVRQGCVEAKQVGKGKRAGLHTHIEHKV